MASVAGYTTTQISPDAIGRIYSDAARPNKMIAAQGGVTIIPNPDPVDVTVNVTAGG